MATTYYADIQKLYVAYFNRPADVAGLQYWETVVENAKGSTAAVSAAFAASAEYKAAYANLDAYHVVNTVYQNLFGHDADLPGLNFWAQNLIAGKFTVDQAVTAIAAGAQGSDATTYNNRVAAAVAFTNLAATTTAGTLNYTGAAANTVAKQFLNGITDNASLTAAIAPTALANAVSNVSNAYLNSIGQTFTLTTGTDTLVGTAGNDVFNATTTTLSTFDSIDGAAGTNVLNLSDVGSGAAASVATIIPGNITVNNIQTINVQTAQTAGANINTAGINGVTKVAVNAASGPATVTVAGTTAVSVAAAGTATVTGGTTQTVSSAGGATLTKATGAIVEADSALGAGSISATGGTSVTVTAAGVTTGTVTVGSSTAAPTGAVSITTTNAAAAAGTSSTQGAINVTGGSTVTVTENLVAPTVTGTTGTVYSETGAAVNVNGTSATTAVTVTQTSAAAGTAGVAAVAAVPAVAQVNTITIAGTVAAGDVFTATVNGNAYTYTATAADTTATVAAGLKAAIAAAGVTAANSGSTVTLTANTAGTPFTATTSVTSAGATDAIATTTANNAGSAAVAAVTPVGAIVDGTVMIIDANSANTDGTKANTITTVTLDGYGANSMVKSNALTSLSLANSAQAVTVVDNTATPTNTTLALSVNNLKSGASLTDNTIKSLNITTGAAASTLALNASADTAITVTGASGLTLNLAGAANVATFDGSAATGAISFGTTGIGTKATSVLTGAGNDNVVLNTVTAAAVAATTTTAAVAAVNLNVGTGAGNDTIDLTHVTGTGNFTVSAGAGADTIIVNQAQLVAGNTIDGGADSDTIKLYASTAATNYTAAAFAAGDYAVINSLVTNVENIEFANNVFGVDASKVAFTGMTFDQGGIVSNVTGQTLSTAGNLTVTAAGYSATAYAGNLNVTTTASSTLNLSADSATVNVKAPVSAAGNTTSIVGDLQTSLTVNLATAANASSSATGDSVAAVNVVTANGLQGLKSIVLTGTGNAVINASGAGVLSSVDASQLTGVVANGSTKGTIAYGLTYTGNVNNVETITLGSGHDVINAASTYGKLDTIVGFDAVKEGSTGASTSDVLVISGSQIGGGASTLTLNGLTALTTGQTTSAGITKLALSAGDTTLDLAFVHAAAAATAGTVVAFQFGGNTYLYADTNGNHTLDNSDFAIKLVGNVDVTGAFGLPPATA